MVSRNICFYVILASEYELHEEYVLVHEECPNREEFYQHARNALRRVTRKLLEEKSRNSRKYFIGLDELVEKAVKILVRDYGYIMPQPVETIRLWSPALFVFECRDEKTKKILGEDLCVKLDEHNEQVRRTLYEEITSKQD